MKISSIFLIFLAAASLFLAGCEMTLSNLTAQKMAQNPSNLYTIAVEAQVLDSAVVADSVRATIVIDGQTYPMKPNPMRPSIFEYDYKMPRGRSEAKYYVVVYYDVKRATSTAHLSKRSDLYTLSLTNRYVITLESVRGPVGASIAVMGRGLTSYDQVLFDGYEVPTVWHSAHHLSFKVPSLPADQSYRVSLRTGNEEMPMGLFKIDAYEMTARPSRLQLETGERSLVVLTLDIEAPDVLPLDITTDIPASIIMPEAQIQAGARSVSIPLEGGEGGKGYLFVEAPGFKSLTIPVEVIGEKNMIIEETLLAQPLDASYADQAPWEPTAD